MEALSLILQEPIPLRWESSKQRAEKNLSGPPLGTTDRPGRGRAVVLGPFRDLSLPFSVSLRTFQREVL